MARKLASIQKITELRSIEGADFIEEAIVGGWHAIVKKDDFQVGDLAVYLEIDSVLNPELDWVKEYALFMEKRKWRVKTMKFRGVLSQGLLLPLDVLPNYIATFNRYKFNRDVDKNEGLHMPQSFKEGNIVSKIPVEQDAPDDMVPVVLSYLERINDDSVAFTFDRSAIFYVPADSVTEIEPYEIKEDVEVTDVLSIEKYSPPEFSGGSGFASGQSKGNFPSYLVPKTDETRIQSCLKCLEELNGKPYYISVKCDGTSGTWLYIDEDDFAACSRNTMKKDDETCVYWKMARKYDIAAKLKDFTWNGTKKRIACQAEVVGPSIQKNRLGLKEVDMAVFNIYDVDKQRYMDYADFIAICDQLELPTVPILEVGESFDYSLEDLLEKAAAATYPESKFPIEGIVIRPLTEMYSEKLKGRLSFKAINNVFLSKTGG